MRLRLVCAFLCCWSVGLVAKPNTGPFRPQQICQAALASLSGFSPKQVRLYRQQGKLWQFNGPYQGQQRSMLCALEGEHARWRFAEDAQWQSSPSIRYSYNSSGKQLQIKHFLQALQLSSQSYRQSDF